MKYQLIIDKDKEETIVITAHERNDLILEIEKLLNPNSQLIGYYENEIVPLDVLDIFAFFTDNGRVYANTKDKNYLIKERIYHLEETLESFIKINQGCLINLSKIKRFETSIGGSIKVIMKNNFSDYISRRELTNVKRRVGL